MKYVCGTRKSTAMEAATARKPPTRSGVLTLRVLSMDYPSGLQDQSDREEHGEDDGVDEEALGHLPVLGDGPLDAGREAPDQQDGKGQEDEEKGERNHPRRDEP